MSVCSCLDGFTTLYAIFEIQCNVVLNSYLASQIYYTIKLSAILFTESIQLLRKFVYARILVGKYEETWTLRESGVKQKDNIKMNFNNL
jgi:hypothetical protein